jgi:hypothetical protein
MILPCHVLDLPDIQEETLTQILPSPQPHHWMNHTSRGIGPDLHEAPNYAEKKWTRQRFLRHKGGKAVDPERPPKSVVAIGDYFWFPCAARELRPDWRAQI